MSKPFVFDRPLQAEFRDVRMGFLREVVSQWKSPLGLRTALDLGCGVGYFAALLKDLGLDVTAVDARAENIEEARSRYPGIDFRVADVDDPSAALLGSFDVVACFGLLYHLENPLRAMRNCRAVTGKVLILESLMLPEEQPFFYLLDEPAGEDQSLGAVSCYPSEGAIIKMAYRAGFPYVYRFRKLPDHEEFRGGVGRARARTAIAASIAALDSPLVELAVEPRLSGDLWTTDPTGVTKTLRRMRRNLKVLRHGKSS